MRTSRAAVMLMPDMMISVSPARRVGICLSQSTSTKRTGRSSSLASRTPEVDLQAPQLAALAEDHRGVVGRNPDAKRVSPPGPVRPPVVPQPARDAAKHVIRRAR